ncbi:hypothetical protein SK128_021132 [Halocaridina rubra]|uniref:BTB domain-containing protein n=1 Tax=Halocaridina rubra TaxID=373956 RepID=A0AAN9A9C5_HALRR
MSDGYLKLRWTGHTSTVVSLLERFRVQGLFCDATISCDRKIYPVHQVVLSACSDFFASLFAATRHQSPIVVLQDVAPAHLESLLLYMYCGETHVRQCDLHLFMKVAESLQIKGLIGANSSEHPDPSTKNLVSDAKESDGVHKKNSSSPLLLSTQTLHGSVRGSSAGEGCQAVHFKEDINQEHHNLRKFPQQEYVSKICSSAGGNDEKSNKERINLGRPEGPDGKNWEDIEDQAREKSSSNVTNVSVSRPCKSENEEIKFKEEVQDGFVHETDPGSCGVWDAVETREDDDDDDDDVYQDLVIAEDDDDIWDAQNNNQVEGLSCHQ